MRETPVTANAAVTQVMNDKSLYYRVLNLASNTFNENETSYHLKSVGGYHPAKLRRYQEMVERYISPEMQALFGAVADAQGDMTKVDGDSIFPVLSMVNTKYFIFPLQSGQAAPLLNPYAFGNGWFVDRVEYVDDANREIAAVGDIDLRRVAVADARFKEAIGESVAQDSTGTVTLTSYDANRLTYDISSLRGGVVVFSDIYYPGWTATVDGVEVPVGRVNYILRAINVKPGAHKVELSFFPKTVDTTETIAYAGYVLLVIIVVLLVLMEYRKRRK